MRNWTKRIRARVPDASSISFSRVTNSHKNHGTDPLRRFVNAICLTTDHRMGRAWQHGQLQRTHAASQARITGASAVLRQNDLSNKNNLTRRIFHAEERKAAHISRLKGNGPAGRLIGNSPSPQTAGLHSLTVKTKPPIARDFVLGSGIRRSPIRTHGYRLLGDTRRFPQPLLTRSSTVSIRSEPQPVGVVTKFCHLS